MTLAVDSVEAVQEAVRAGPRVLPVGGGTKPALSTPPADDVIALDLSSLRGLVEYDPAELTLTALAGTPVADLDEALAVHGQHLPFDPPLSAAGATLGGVVAAGTSGPGAFRHGGVRDFVIGVRFVDGSGRLVAGGGKVVKNAAGFDLPKLLVGSMGRLGAIVQLSLKVFPRPRATTTLVFDLGGTEAALDAMARLGRGPLDLDALDLDPPARLLVRLGGDPDALPARAARLAETVPAAGRPLGAERGRGALARRRRARVGAVDEPGGPRGADGPVGPRPRGGARGRRRPGPLQPRRERRLDRLARGAPARGARRGAGASSDWPGWS